MKPLTASALFFLATIAGVFLSIQAGNQKSIMQIYASGLAALSIIVVLLRYLRHKQTLFSCYTMVLLAPIWFLYLEAILPNGDAWLLPTRHVVYTLSYASFFLFVFNAAYIFSPPRFVREFHEKNFLRIVSPSFLPSLGIFLTLLTFFVIFARYGFDWEETKRIYLAGRATGSGGLIKRGGVGGWEVFLQPLSFMAASVPTIAALSFVRFRSEAVTPLLLRLLVATCACLLIFVMFLGGSRGNMAVYLAGPAAIWALFGAKSVGRIPFIVVSIVLVILLIGVWEFQKRKRQNLLEGIRSTSDFVQETTFDVTETHRDNNLYIFTLHHMYMPNPFPYHGYGEVFMLLTNPIPRAIWPDKPKGIQESRRTFTKVSGPAAMGPVRIGTSSLSQSIVGDGFKMHHYFGIALYAAVFACLSSMWDAIGVNRFTVTKLYFILHCAWMFWFLWGFRAAFAFTTGMYSVWGAYVLCFVASLVSSRPLIPCISQKFSNAGAFVSSIHMRKELLSNEKKVD